jgi:glycosyltransferase involved in cell wall biosynthesis
LRAALACARSRGWLARTPLRKVGYLDVPAQGSELEEPGPHVVRGWVFEPARARGVVVSVDRRPVAVATVNIPRRDVVETLGLPDSELVCGWAVNIELAGGAGSQVEISAVLRLADNRLLPISTARVRLVDNRPEPEGQIDVPADGSVVTLGAMSIRGWALFPDGLPASVELRLNGRARRARTGAYRSDLGLRFPGFGNMSGFEELVDITDHAPGESLTIDALATSFAGNTLKLRPVVCRVGDAPDSVMPAEAARASVLRSRTEQAARDPAADERIRLAVFTHDLGYGGGQLYLHELLRRWATQPGFSAVVVAPADGPLRPQLEASGIEVHVCGGYPLDSVDGYEGRVRELVDWARPQGFNLAMVNTMMGFLGADVATRLGLPVVWGIHESFEMPVYWQLAHGDGAHPYVKERAMHVLRQAALVAFEADATRRLYEPHVAHAATLPYGVAIDDIDAYLRGTDRAAVREAYGLAPEDVVILCVGTIEPRKSQAALAQAFVKVARAHPAARLVFIGDSGSPSARALHDFVARSGAAHRIRVLPVVAEIFPWYLCADLFVSASDAESLPRSVLEAMAFSVPVLAAEVFGLPELIKDGVNGFLCPARDTAALASALDRVLSLDPARLVEVAGAGAALVRDKHDSARCAAEYWRRMLALVEPS